ncbi:Rieske 2Fe-2S domain-containing protein [Kitasatospora arboriphila]
MEQTTAHHGWYLLAFRSELTDDITPLAVGGHRLIAVKEGDRVRVLDATCPHRGAHLGFGGLARGRLRGLPLPRQADRPRRPRQALVGRRAHRPRLGRRPLRPALRRPRRRPRLRTGRQGLGRHLPARRGRRPAGRRPPRVRRRERLRPRPLQGRARRARHPRHGRPHRRQRRTRHRGRIPHADVALAGRPRLEEIRWQAIRTRTVRWDYRPRFLARAFSPSVVVTEFGPPEELHVIVTGSVPAPGGGCTARVAIGVRTDQQAALPALVGGSRKALEEDKVVWENLDPHAVPRYDARDEPVLAFRAFCADFATRTAPGGAR